VKNVEECSTEFFLVISSTTVTPKVLAHRNPLGCWNPKMCGSPQLAAIETLRLPDMKMYRSRVFIIDAETFTGGIANAREILNWVNHNGGTAVWCGSIPPYQYADGRVKHHGVPESLRLKTPTGWRMINIGDIIAQISPGKFDSFTKEGFDHLYEEEPSEKLADVVVLPTRNSNHKIIS
jgi:hypothetical protein